MGSFLGFIGFRSIALLFLSVGAVLSIMLLVGIIAVADVVETVGSCSCNGVESTMQCNNTDPQNSTFKCQDVYDRINAIISKLKDKVDIVLDYFSELLSNLLEPFDRDVDLKKIKVDVD